MFKKLKQDVTGAGPSAVTLMLDGRTITAQAGDTVAAALLAAGALAFRTSPSAGTLRGPYCMMGVCFECLVTIDGRANRQACMTAVAPGMDVRTSTGADQ